MFFRLRRVGRPHMHGVVGRMYIKATDIGTILKNINGGAQQPVVDLAAVDRWRWTKLLHPFRSWLLGREHDVGSAQEESDRLCLARKERGLNTMPGSPLKKCGSQQEFGRLHVVLDATFFVKIGVSGDPVLLWPNTAADGGVIDIGNGGH